jgi:hypothetical protein
VLPFIVLPAGAVLAWTRGPVGGAAWKTFAVLVGAGVFVNLAAVLADQRTSFAEQLTNVNLDLARMEAQRWDPKLSPVLIQWKQVVKHLSAFAEWSSQPVSLISGTYAKEPVAAADAEAALQSELFPRWTNGSAVFELRNHGQPTRLRLEYLDNRPASIGPAVVQIVVDGSPLPDADVTRSRSKIPLPDKRLPWFLDADLDTAVIGQDSATIEIRSQAWQPARDAPPSTDIRELGIQIWNIRFESNGNELPLREAPFSPMPVTDARPWSYDLETWFYEPPHLVDMWPWFLYLSGLPQQFALAALLPMAGAVWAGWRLCNLLRTGFRKFQAL